MKTVFEVKRETLLYLNIIFWTPEIIDSVNNSLHSRGTNRRINIAETTILALYFAAFVRFCWSTSSDSSHTFWEAIVYGLGASASALSIASTLTTCRQ